MDKLLDWNDVEWCIGTEYADNRIISLKNTLVAALVTGGYDEEIVKAHEKKKLVKFKGTKRNIRRTALNNMSNMKIRLF